MNRSSTPRSQTASRKTTRCPGNRSTASNAARSCTASPTRTCAHGSKPAKEPGVSRTSPQPSPTTTTKKRGRSDAAPAHALRQLHRPTGLPRQQMYRLLLVAASSQRTRTTRRTNRSPQPPAFRPIPHHRRALAVASSHRGTSAPHEPQAAQPGAAFVVSGEPMDPNPEDLNPDGDLPETEDTPLEEDSQDE